MRFNNAILLVVFALTLNAQNYNFSNFYLEDGLSQSQVFDICQDSIGRMWFTTFGGGITIYDGANVEYITDKEGLPSNIIHALFVDDKKNIWIGTDNGVAFYNGDSLIRIEKTIGNQLEFWNIEQDFQGNIWLGSDKGLFLYMDTIVKSVPQEVLDVPTFCIYNGSLLISGLVNGIGVYNGENINTNFINELDHRSITSLHEDNYGNLWITTTRGVYKYYEGKLTNETSKLELNEPYILTMKHDQQNRYWFGTNSEGLVVLEGKKLTKIREDQGIMFNKVEKIYEDNMSNIWVGTDGGGVSIFKDFTFTNLTFERILPNNFVWSILVDSKDVKWFGTDGNGLMKLENGEIKVYTKNNSNLYSNHINALFEDSKNRIWAGTSKGINLIENGIIRTFKNDFIGNVLSICEDYTGHIWFGSYGEGLLRYDGKKLDYFTEKDGLGSNYIWSFFPNEDGSLFIGTESGLTIYQDSAFDNLTTEEGLIDESIWSILKGHYGNYWIITDISLTWYNGEEFINYQTSELFNSNVLYLVDTFNINHLVLGSEKGLDKITYTQNGDITSIKHFDREDGFYGIECNANAISRDKEGVFWIGTVNGVTTYNPAEESANIHPPLVYIKEIKLFYESVNWSDYTDSVNKWTSQPSNLILKHNQNNLTFEFVGINYKNPKRVRYQYILEGNDPTWHPPTTKNEATYTNIPPGEYSFKIKASNEDGIWSKSHDFQFVIKPPYWQTNIFIILISIFILILVYLILYLRTYQLQRLRVKLSNKVKERTAELNEQKEELQSALTVIREQKEELESTLVINQKQKSELERANVEIQKSSKLKEIFLANTSHEIRTPLNVINGYTNLLLNTDLESRQIEYLKNIKTSSNNLLNVVNDILDFSKIEAGKLKLEEIEFNLHNLIRDIYSAISLKATEKKLSFKYSIQNTVPKFVKGDPFRLNQILINLVRNAIKFTNEGGLIKLIVQLENKNEEKAEILFIVEDTGIGIERGKLKTIFDSFTQASTETTRKYGGTGLGLSIVKNLVDLQKGSIDVDSQKNVGSIFRVRITYSISTGKDLKKKENNFIIETSKKLKKLNILLVEDNPLNVTLAIDTILMYNNKMNVDVAINGKQAIEKVMHKSYDLIIMDIQMPEMDGYDTTKYIREELKGPKKEIPILGMSAHTMKEEQEKCMEIGMNAYLSKPFVPEELFNKIESMTGGMQKQISYASEEVIDLPKLNVLDISKLLKIYNNDTKKLNKILNSYLKHLPELYQKLEDAMNEEDFSAIKISAHSLKTSLKFIGAKKHSELSKYIELNAQNGDLKQILNDNFEVLKTEFQLVLDEINLILQSLNEKQTH